MKFEREIADIYRLKIPFDNLYTSVFLIKTEQGNALVDCATYASDVDEYIVPALHCLGLRLTDIAYLVLTHNHSDHSGGKARLLELAPNIEVVQSECDSLLNGVAVYALKGHTLDCVGFFDKKSKTLKVEVVPEKDTTYRIDFITTKKDFDSSIEYAEYPHTNPKFNRRRPVIREDVGVVAKSVEGVSGEYTMSDDDLYVRCVVT